MSITSGGLSARRMSRSPTAPLLRPWVAGVSLMLLVWSSLIRAQPELPIPIVEAEPTQPQPGESLLYRIRLHNPDSQVLAPLLLTLQWPDAAYPIGLDGVADPEYDYESRSVRAWLELEPGAELRIGFRVLTARQASHLDLPLEVGLSHPTSDRARWIRHQVEASRDYSDVGIVLGSVRLLPITFVILGGMLVAALLFLVLLVLGSRRGVERGPFGAGPLYLAMAATCCLMFPVAIWGYYAHQAWRDARILSVWQPCTATVLGGRIIEHAATSGFRDRSSSRPARSSFTPELALRYEVDGQTLYSTGYDSGSSLRSGGRAARSADLARWKPGARVACWFDPADPYDVVVYRGPGFAYLLALIPLPVFWLGWILARKTLRKSATPPP